MRENTIVTQLKDAETIIQDYKVRQKIAGDSWVMYRSQSDRQWDMEFYGTNTAVDWVKRWKITYQIDGGRVIPNAFALFYPTKVLDGIEVDYFGTTAIQTMGFNWGMEDDGFDPLSSYLIVKAGYNWTNTTDSFIKLKFRALSPYKGSLKWEELTS